MAGVAELGGRPIAIATFSTPDVSGFVSFLPEPGAGVHVFANLVVSNAAYHGKTLGMHIHSHETHHHFDGGKNTAHGVWPKGHAGDLHNNVVVSSKGRVLLSFVDNRLSVAAGNPACVIGHAVYIHAGADDCGLGGSACSEQNGCAGNTLATATITRWGAIDACA